VKLVDFGLASVAWDEQAVVARVESVGYIAPEVLTLPCPPQTTQVDCFSAGVLLYTCLAGHGPFQGRHLKEVLVKKLHNSVSMQAMTWFPPGARDLVTQLLETRPEDRPTAGQCLRHPWLQRPRADGRREEAGAPESAAGPRTAPLRGSACGTRGCSGPGTPSP